LKLAADDHARAFSGDYRIEDFGSMSFFPLIVTETCVSRRE
jgi:hypothetical protein